MGNIKKVPLRKCIGCNEMKNKKISKIFQKSVDKYTDGCYYTITKRKQHKTQYKVSQLLKGG